MSKANARPCNLEWIRGIVAQCRAASVPAFVKQLGSRPYTSELWNMLPGADKVYNSDEVLSNPALMKEAAQGLGMLLENSVVTIRDRKGGDMDEWPADLRIREFPKAVQT